MKVSFKKIVLFQVLGFLFLISACTKEKTWVDLPDIPLVESEYKATLLNSAIVYHAAPYNAFTDLVFYEGNFYLTFRAGARHNSDSTSSIRILRSKDFSRWDLISSIKDSGFDVRDPKFLLDRGQLYLNYTSIDPNASVNIKQFNLFNINGNDNTAAFNNSFKSSDIWYWYTGVFQGELLSIGYKNAKVGYYNMHQSKSPYLKCALDLPNHASEGRFVVDKKHMYSVIRTKYKGILAISNLRDICSPKLWQLPVYQLGGPNVTIFNENNLLISGRELIENNNSGQFVKTSLFLFNIKNNTVSKLLELPSYSDNGYAGHVVRNDTIFVSYYDHHLSTGKAVIKTARIKVVKKDV